MRIVQKRVARLWLTVGLLVVVGLAVSSCLSDVFNRRPKPLIDIVAGSPFGPAPLEIVFDISGSYDPDGTITRFEFDFGDGTEAVEGMHLWKPIEHTYETPGDYMASLTVTDSRGASSMAMMPIGVWEPEVTD